MATLQTGLVGSSRERGTHPYNWAEPQISHMGHIIQPQCQGHTQAPMGSGYSAACGLEGIQFFLEPHQIKWSSLPPVPVSHNTWNLITLAKFLVLEVFLGPH